MAQIIEVALDDHGGILLPESVGDQLGLTPGATLVVEQEVSGGMRLRLQQQALRVMDKGGVLVVQSEASGDLTHAVQIERDRRNADLVKPMSQ